MSDTRDVYFEPADRAVIRTADVYQTEIESGVAGYSDTLLAIVANFRNSGRPEGFNAQSMVGKSKRGEVALRIFAVVDPETEVIRKAGFKCRGCLAMTAAASVICEMIEGKTFPEAMDITEDDIREALDGVPWDKSYTLTFAVEAVRALYGDWLYRGGAGLEQLDALVPCDTYSTSCLVCEHCSLRNTRTDLLVEGVMQKQGEPADASESIAMGAPVAAGAAAAEAGRATAESEGFSPLASEEREDNAEASATDESEGQLTDEEKRAAERRALALLFQEVRRASADSRLSQPNQWPQLDFFPAHLSPEDFEMMVYEYLEAEGDPHQVQASVARGQKAPANPHIHSRFKTAKGAVGVPKIFQAMGKGAESDSAEDAPDDQSAEAASEPQREPLFVSAFDSDPAEAPASEDTYVDQNTGLRIPRGYRLEEIDGELVLVACDDGNAEPPLVIDCDGIRALVGRHSYYLYDQGRMTDTFARWAFLAAEDDPMVTLAECTREECRTYPRPLSQDTLANDPFRMDASVVERAFSQMKGLEDFSDIGRVENSIGEAYYYSSELMTEEMAKSLAEFYGVERPASV